jgi:hypothetical protein
MKMLSGLGRNDVIRVVALVSVVAFPLIADAQLGRSSGAVTPSRNVSTADAAPVKAALAARDSCANQHWPFFSAECLHGSREALAPRLVSMNVEPQPNPVKTDDSPKARRTADAAQGDAPAARSKKPAKRIVMHERSTPNVNYAVNSDAGRLSMPGW